MKKYYGWIDLADGGYLTVVMFDTEKFETYDWKAVEKRWNKNMNSLEVRHDTTHWDEITPEVALATIRKISNDDTLELE